MRGLMLVLVAACGSSPPAARGVPMTKHVEASWGAGAVLWKGDAVIGRYSDKQACDDAMYAIFADQHVEAAVIRALDVQRDACKTAPDGDECYVARINVESENKRLEQQAAAYHCGPRPM